MTPGPRWSVSHRVVIVGATRSGKSLLARSMFQAVPPPRLVIDPKDDVTTTGGDYAVTFRDPARLPQEPVVRYVPRDPLDTAAYDAVYTSVWREGRGRFVWCDESQFVLPSRGAPPAAVRHLTQGGGKGFGHLTLNQRPVEIDPMVMGNAEHVVVFRLGYEPDVATIAATMGRPGGEVRDLLAGLPDYHYLWYDRLQRIPFRSAPVRVKGES